jgi:hypothetical protein
MTQERLTPSEGKDTRVTSFKTLLQRSVGEKESQESRGVRDDSWSTLDYMVLPSDPQMLLRFFMSRLGPHQLGIGVFADAPAGLTVVFGFGLTETTFKVRFRPFAQDGIGPVLIQGIANNGRNI